MPFILYSVFGFPSPESRTTIHSFIRRVVILRIGIAIVSVLCLQHPGDLDAVEGTDKITTFAGSVTGGFTGDGGTADEAKLMEPEGIAIDEKGGIYIADTGNHVIRHVGLDGIITTIAGTGERGSSGDGGLATEASFNNPRDVAVDSKGNIYIADTTNNRIRVVDLDGIVTTFAALNRPFGVAVDRTGNVYICERNNHRVRKVNAFSGIITTIAGSDEEGFDGDGGPGTEANLSYPTDLAIDVTDIYIADTRNDRIRHMDVTGGITTFAGGRGDRALLRTGVPATDAALWWSTGVAVDSIGNIYIADSRNHRIRVVNESRVIDTLAGSRFEKDPDGNILGGYSGDGGPANQAELNTPHGVAVDADGINLYFSDNQNHRVRRVGPGGILALMVTSLTFDTTGVGGSSMQTLEVQNIGTEPLTLTRFTFSGSGRRDYQGQETLPTIDPGGIETITVIFNPSREGARPATLFVESDVGTKGIDVTGFAVEDGPEISLSVTTLALETIKVGENPVQGSFTITNLGTEYLSISGIILEGTHASEFEVSPTAATIASGASETITVILSPTSPGTKSASLLIDHTAGDPTIVRLSGVAYAAGTSPDFDGTGKVDLEDFFLFAAAFSQEPTGDNTRFDLDGNNKIDFDDFFIFAGAFGKTL